jgi:hypothetical protein
VTSAKFKGASGLVIIVAPLFASDSSELPLILYAVTLAKMLSPNVKANGF